MRTPLLAGNWKMNGLRGDAEALARAIASRSSGVDGREVLLAPPFTALEAVARGLGDSPVKLGAQNLHWEPKGAFTGEVSAAMLADAGCSHVILGHSERRQFFGETDADVAKKIGAAHQASLVPIVCVGESLAEREADRTLDVVGSQLRGGLAGLAAGDIGGLVVAYEPVWAIGTGKVASPAQAQEVHAFIRQTLAELADEAAASRCRILYGGSVKPDNVDELMAEADIDGALVGGASLDADSFLRIVQFH